MYRVNSMVQSLFKGDVQESGALNSESERSGSSWHSYCPFGPEWPPKAEAQTLFLDDSPQAVSQHSQVGPGGTL